MVDQFSSLDVLAEAALFYSANQENNAQSINCSPTISTMPKKRKHYLLHLYEAEQRSLNAAQGRLNSNSSDYSTTPESSPESSPHESSPEPTSPVSFGGSPTLSISPEVKAPESATVSSAAGSTAKKNKSSKKASSTKPTSDDAKSALSEFVKKVSITPKLDANLTTKSLDELRDSVFDENVKIEVKTPKLTYTLRGMRNRKPSTKTPDHLKDQDYFEKRERNNLAARKSRNNKNAAIRTSALKVKQLESERKELDGDLGEQILIMKFLQMKMEADPALSERVMTIVQEKQLAHFSKVLELKSAFSL